MANEKINITVENWKIKKSSEKYRLIGYVVDHPKYNVGDIFQSAPLIYIDFITMTAETPDLIIKLLEFKNIIKYEGRQVWDGDKPQTIYERTDGSKSGKQKRLEYYENLNKQKEKVNIKRMEK